MTIEDVRQMFPRIIQPPHPYYDLENQKRSSKFPPKQPSVFYQPFIEFFQERAQTCRAQAALDERKGKRERAKRYAGLAADWAGAAAVAIARQERSFLAEQLEAQQLVVEIERTH